MKFSIGNKSLHHQGIVVAGITLLVFMLFNACKHDPQEELLPTKPSPSNPNPNPTPTNDSVSFQTEILPLLIANCAKGGCHDANTAAEDMVLNSYANVMQLVTPFSTGNSELYEVITETRPSKRMPPPPAAPLDASQIALIAKWINQGARNTNIIRCDTNTYSFSGAVNGILATHCNGCHSNTGSGGGVLLNSYTEVKSVALSGKLLCTVEQQGTCSPMPKGGAKLEACKITIVKKWINAGCPNN